MLHVQKLFLQLYAVCHSLCKTVIRLVLFDKVTYEVIASSVLSMVLREGANSENADEFDTGGNPSRTERSVPGEETDYQLQSIKATRIVRQWKKFLSVV